MSPSDKHKMREIIKFGERLIVAEDLDPVYMALYKAGLPSKQMLRLLLAYFLFYHLGVAAALSEFEGDHFWDLIENAAANEIPPNMNGDWPGDRWPRGSERRHFRGKQAVQAAKWFRTQPASKGIRFVTGAAGPQREVAPEFFVSSLCMFAQPVPLRLIMDEVQNWNMCGPWIAFKVADVLERVLKINVAFPNDLTLFYAEPRKALDMLELPAEEANAKLLKHFAKFKAPPRYERSCGIAECETILCKAKSNWNGKYWVGKDIHEVRKHLVGWGKTSDRLLACMPVEVPRYEEHGLFAQR